MYKEDPGDFDCADCPDNSDSLSTGSISCPCLSGYYRAAYESFDMACTGKFMSCESILVSMIILTLFKQATV